MSRGFHCPESGTATGTSCNPCRAVVRSSRSGIGDRRPVTDQLPHSRRWWPSPRRQDDSCSRWSQSEDWASPDQLADAVGTIAQVASAWHPRPAPSLAAHRVRRGELSGQGVVLLSLLWSAGQFKGLPEHVERIRIERVGID